MNASPVLQHAQPVLTPQHASLVRLESTSLHHTGAKTVTSVAQLAMEVCKRTVSLATKLQELSVRENVFVRLVSRMQKETA
jgi:hypothetical protein